MQTNHVISLASFTPEIFNHFNSFIPLDVQAKLSQTTKKIRDCATEARRAVYCEACKHEQKLKKEFGDPLTLKKRLEKEDLQLRDLEHQLFNTQYSLLGIVVTIVSSKVCSMLKIMSLFFYVFPSLKRCADQERSCKESLEEQNRLIKKLKDAQAELCTIQSFKESEKKEPFLIDAFGSRKNFDALPYLKWTNPTTKKVDLDCLELEHLSSPYAKGIDDKGRKFLVIRYHHKENKQPGFQLIYQSAQGSPLWRTAYSGQALLATSQEKIDLDFIHHLKIIISRGETDSNRIF